MVHTFDSCPVRPSSSLVIIDRNSQTIEAATENVVDLFGYGLSDLIGKPVAVLGLDRKQCTARHARGGRIPLEICIHHDPLQSTCSPLDYWLVRPVPVQHYPLKKPTALIINPYGIIERMDSSRWMVGRPIMSFIHYNDVQTLCGHLDRLYRDHTSHSTMHARWSCQPNEYQWITITSLIDDLRPSLRSRVTCVLRPVEHPKTLDLLNRQEQSWAREQMWEQGKAYVLEFITHVMNSIADMLLPVIDEKKQAAIARVMDGDALCFADLFGQSDTVNWQQRWKAFAVHAVTAHPLTQTSIAVLNKAVPTQLIHSLETCLEWITASLTAILQH